MRPRVRATVVLPLLVAMTACVPDNRPASCDEEAVTIELTVRGDGMQPSEPAACQGQQVTLAITPQVDGVFHIHGLDKVVPATTITEGQEIELTFTPEGTGQFPIELHPADDPQGVAIGIFSIYDR
jgi:hypothetical protein